MQQKPQSTIFAEESAQYHYHHLEYSINDEVSIELLKKALCTITCDLKQNLDNLEVHSLVAFGYQFWNSLSNNQAPEELKDFESISGKNGDTMPASQYDFTFWIKSSNHSALIDKVLKIHNAVKNYANLELEVSGFNYHDSRDLIGFVDGTGNPKDDLRLKSALIPEGSTGAGGSYVLTQKWIHKLTKFNSLDVHSQEKCVGRTKLEDIEFEYLPFRHRHDFSANPRAHDRSFTQTKY